MHDLCCTILFADKGKLVAFMAMPIGGINFCKTRRMGYGRGKKFSIENKKGIDVK